MNTQHHAAMPQMDPRIIELITTNGQLQAQLDDARGHLLDVLRHVEVGMPPALVDRITYNLVGHGIIGTAQ